MGASSGAPRARWGWHRLTDHWAERLVDRSGVGPGDLVIDIGAGEGAITRHLVAAGARVLAVELHPGRASGLRRQYATASVRVLEVDASDLWLPGRPFRVVANPPFAITTAVLRRLLSPRSRLQRADLVVPRYAAARWSSGRAPDSARWSAHFTVETIGYLPRRAFVPAPPEPAVVLRLQRRPSRGSTRGC